MSWAFSEAESIDRTVHNCVRGHQQARNHRIKGWHDILSVAKTSYCVDAQPRAQERLSGKAERPVQVLLKEHHAGSLKCDSPISGQTMQYVVKRCCGKELRRQGTQGV